MGREKQGHTNYGLSSHPVLSERGSFMCESSLIPYLVVLPSSYSIRLALCLFKSNGPLWCGSID